MKRIIALVGLMTLVSGCAWLHGDGGSSTGGGGIGGVDYNQGRGTTGVSSGAGAAQGITGSDAAPPK
jgi:hypothetical protein